MPRSKRLISALALRLGYRIYRVNPGQVAAQLEVPADMGESFNKLYLECRPYTITTVQRMYELYQAIHYISRSNIQGDIVECGVWKGGSMMLAALALQERGAADRGLWLYDTFEGMTQPDERDRDYSGVPATRYFGTGEQAAYYRVGVDAVQDAMRRTRYPEQRMHFVKGRVEDTIPASAPSQIALLRLDTDWYESTRHEMEHLYPRLAPGGVLILDDYGAFVGARQAVDEYFREHGIDMWLHRIDVCRLGIKT
jgi:hypothetical protein